MILRERELSSGTPNVLFGFMGDYGVERSRGCIIRVSTGIYNKYIHIPINKNGQKIR